MTAEITKRRAAMLGAMGIDRWVTRDTPEVSAEAPDRDTGSGLPIDAGWDPLAHAVETCTRCELHRSRTRTVFGVGDRQASWLLIGEAPGAEEDRRGEPFVGRAGGLLNAMLQAAGVKREQVFIANILKCRPPNNRDPKAEEASACADHLMAQINLIKPSLILAVGRIAAQNLLQTEQTIGRLRGQVHQFRDTGIPLVVIYHPAYLLRSPGEKRKAWDDLRLALATAPPIGEACTP